MNTPINFFKSMEASSIRHFASHKINRVRWKPEVMDESEYFITGSTDEEENALNLWWYPLNPVELEQAFNDPVLKSTLPQKGDITALEFLNSNTAAFASGLGSVHLVNVSKSSITVQHSWEKLHYYKTGEPCVCSDISCLDEDIASVGEDGRIVLLTANEPQPVRVIDGGNSCPIMCTTFLNHCQLVTGNLRGQCKLWDVRTDDGPESTFMASHEGAATMCVTTHPTQKHLLLAGGQEGSLTVWDLRQSSYPVNVLTAHNSAVSEIQFHRERPEHVFTSSWSGDIWQWKMNRSVRDAGGEDTHWLNSDASKHRMEIISLVTPQSKPVNCIDVNRTRLVAGCDSQAILIIKDLQL